MLTEIRTGPDEKYAQDFLERIAAICNPIMKKYRLAVMSLEEYEYNTEFLGRNFNGGGCLREEVVVGCRLDSCRWL